MVWKCILCSKSNNVPGLGLTHEPHVTPFSSFVTQLSSEGSEGSEGAEPILPFVQILMDSDEALTYTHRANYPGHEEPVHGVTGDQ